MRPSSGIPVTMVADHLISMATCPSTPEGSARRPPPGFAVGPPADPEAAAACRSSRAPAAGSEGAVAGDVEDDRASPPTDGSPQAIRRASETDARAAFRALCKSNPSENVVTVYRFLGCQPPSRRCDRDP
jgi:hypothetical protein